MSDDFFRDWTEKTAESKTTPTDRLVELLQQYQLRLQGITVDSSTTSKTHIVHNSAKQKHGIHKCSRTER